jgi:hypothetical protein
MPEPDDLRVATDAYSTIPNRAESAIWSAGDWVRRLAEFLWWIVERRMFMLIRA